MRTLICANCGLATVKEFASCPSCRRKDLKYFDSFHATTQYDSLAHRRGIEGSHPLVSLAVFTIVAMAFTGLMYTWMFPIH